MRALTSLQLAMNERLEPAGCLMQLHSDNLEHRSAFLLFTSTNFPSGKLWGVICLTPAVTLVMGVLEAARVVGYERKEYCSCDLGSQYPSVCQARNKHLSLLQIVTQKHHL